MKRFLLFGCEAYYPAGGWGDFVADFDTAEEAFAFEIKPTPDWRQVVDTTTLKEVQPNNE